MRRGSISSQARSDARAKPCNWCAPGSGSIRRPIAPTRGLTEVSFGAWEGFTTEELRAHAPDAVAAREPTSGTSRRRRPKATLTMSLRVHDWYRSLTRDTVAVAHGGTLRGLIVQLGIASAAEAPFLDVAQGVVYVIRPGSIDRYG